MAYNRVGAPVADALGTQRQFTRQPEQIYQKALINPASESGIGDYTRGTYYNTQALQNALGLLGRNIIREFDSIQQREKDRINLEQVQQFVQNNDLSTVDKVASAIANDPRAYRERHNPYFMATLDNEKGKYLSKIASFNTEQKLEQANPQSVQEGLQIYNDEVNAIRDNMAGSGVRNKFAFNVGFQETRNNDMLRIAEKIDKQINEKRIFEATQMSFANALDDVENYSDATIFGEAVRNNLKTLAIAGGKDSYKRQQALLYSYLDGIKEYDTNNDRVKEVEKIAKEAGIPISTYKYRRQISDNSLYFNTKNLSQMGLNEYGVWDSNKFYNGWQQSMNYAPSVIPYDIKSGVGYVEREVNPALKQAYSNIGGEILNVNPDYEGKIYLKNNPDNDSNSMSIGVVDADEQDLQNIKDNLSPYFKDISYSTNNNGETTISLDGYKGGLDGKKYVEDKSIAHMLNAERIAKQQVAVQKANDKIMKARMFDEDCIEIANNCNNANDVMNLIKGKGYTYRQQQTLLGIVNKKQKATQSLSNANNINKINKTVLTKTDAYYNKPLESSGDKPGKTGVTQYVYDLRVVRGINDNIARLQRAYDDASTSGLEIDRKKIQQEISDEINKYWAAKERLILHQNINDKKYTTDSNGKIIEVPNTAYIKELDEILSVKSRFILGVNNDNATTTTNNVNSNTTKYAMEKPEGDFLVDKNAEPPYKPSLPEGALITNDYAPPVKNNNETQVKQQSVPKQQVAVQQKEEPQQKQLPKEVSLLQSNINKLEKMKEEYGNNPTEKQKRVIDNLEISIRIQKERLDGRTIKDIRDDLIDDLVNKFGYSNSQVEAVLNAHNLKAGVKYE